MSEIGVAIIGAGIIAEAHRAAIESTEVLTVAAVVEPVAKRREALACRTGAVGFAEFGQLLGDRNARPAVDAVVICTPPSARIDLVESALSAGLPVLVEKPLAHLYEDAQALVEVARRHAMTPAAVAFCHRFTPAIQTMKRMLNAGDLGVAVRFENTFACWHPSMQEHWMSNPDVSGGGSLLDTGCHSLDLFHYLVGHSQVDAAVFHHHWAGRGDSNGTLLVHSVPTSVNASPVAGVLVAGWAEPARFTTTLVGTAGLLHYDFEKPEELVWKRSDGPPETLKVETHEVRFQRQLESFAALIRNPSAASELASFEDGLAVSVSLQNAHDQALGV